MLKRALRWESEGGAQEHSSDSEYDSGDDGPDPETRKLLEELEAKYGAQADAMKAAGLEIDIDTDSDDEDSDEEENANDRKKRKLSDSVGGNGGNDGKIKVKTVPVDPSTPHNQETPYVPVGEAKSLPDGSIIGNNGAKYICSSCPTKTLWLAAHVDDHLKSKQHKKNAHGVKFDKMSEGQKQNLLKKAHAKKEKRVQKALERKKKSRQMRKERKHQQSEQKESVETVQEPIAAPKDSKKMAKKETPKPSEKKSSKSIDASAVHTDSIEKSKKSTKKVAESNDVPETVSVKKQKKNTEKEVKTPIESSKKTSKKV